MKILKGLLTSVAFLVGIVSVFSFKSSPSQKGAFVTRWTLDNSNPQKCIITDCVATAPNFCGLNGVYQDNVCTMLEKVFIKKF
ncbi:hypothetical protein PV783_13885 [Chitinophaga sp. CC14]|uniref:hypothetical protein n=1 Tax=Chitinophaga sp. CC14 TaxID=3029199 RepID=UPI003B7D6DCE